tara:strand:+ start:289 stop:666 length:378 start_codon:yes stop_codon:yes gene_type:complete
MKYLNHSKAELRKFTKAKLVSLGHGILKKLPKSTLVNTVFNLEQLAKSKGIRSVGKIARKAGRKARSGARRAKTGITRRTRRKTYRKRNGRTIQKSKRRSKQLIRGSPQAKAWGKKMARIRSRSR